MRSVSGQQALHVHVLCVTTTEFRLYIYSLNSVLDHVNDKVMLP